MLQARVTDFQRVREKRTLSASVDKIRATVSNRGESELKTQLVGRRKRGLSSVRYMASSKVQTVDVKLKYSKPRQDS